MNRLLNIISNDLSIARYSGEADADFITISNQITSLIARRCFSMQIAYLAKIADQV